MEMNHADQPAMCPDCHAAFLADVEARATATPLAVFAYCGHTGTGVLCRIKDGRVQHWMVDAPMSWSEAQRRARHVATAMETVVHDTFSPDRQDKH